MTDGGDDEVRSARYDIDELQAALHAYRAARESLRGVKRTPSMDDSETSANLLTLTASTDTAIEYIEEILEAVEEETGGDVCEQCRRIVDGDELLHAPGCPNSRDPRAIPDGGQPIDDWDEFFEDREPTVEDTMGRTAPHFCSGCNRHFDDFDRLLNHDCDDDFGPESNGGDPPILADGVGVEGIDWSTDEEFGRVQPTADDPDLQWQYLTKHSRDVVVAIAIAQRESEHEHAWRRDVHSCVRTLYQTDGCKVWVDKQITILRNEGMVRQHDVRGGWKALKLSDHAEKALRHQFQRLQDAVGIDGGDQR